MEPLARDLRFALKLLVKQKSFTLAVLVTLALCVGANAAVFSVVDAVLFQPLPFAAPDRIVRVFNSYPGAGVERGGNGVPDYYDRLEHVPAFEHQAYFNGTGVTIGESGRPERVTAMRVTPSLFDVLGARPVVGRTFTPEVGEWGGPDHVVISHRLWQEQYGGSGDVVGASLRVDGREHTIVGVMPPRFVFHEAGVQLWLPLRFNPAMRSDEQRHSNNYESVALLRAGTTREQAQAQVDALNRANEERFPQFRELLRSAGFHTRVEDYRADLTRDVRGTLLLLQAGVALVLLIGCVNVANLVLVRSTARHRELATRAALGAGRVSIVRQLLTENVVLGIAGGVLGLGVGWAAVRTAATFLTGNLPRGSEIGLDARTVVVTFALAITAGLIAGLLPALRLLRADLSSVFREEGRTGTAGRATRTWRGALVVAQVALAFTLLVGAGMVALGYARTLAVRTGFNSDGLLTATIALPQLRYPDRDARRLFITDLIERLDAVPGVARIAATSVLPFGSGMNASIATVEGHAPRPDERPLVPVFSRVSTGYLTAMEIPVIAGRGFEAADADDGASVAIIDSWLAERFWPGQDPIGRRFTQGAPGVGRDDDLFYRTVIGVVEPVRVGSLTGDEPLGHVYTPITQDPPGAVTVVMRTTLDPMTLAAPLRDAVRAIDPDLAVHDVRTMDARIATSLDTDRARSILIVAFAALALFLAAVGLYGVLAWTVAQRTAEIGIRMALGGSTSHVFRIVVAQGIRLAGIGLVLGAAASFVMARIVRGMVFGVGAADPVVYTTVLALLATTAILATALPARRAMRVDPIIAIRE